MAWIFDISNTLEPNIELDHTCQAWLLVDCLIVVSNMLRANNSFLVRTRENKKKKTPNTIRLRKEKHMISPTSPKEKWWKRKREKGHTRAQRPYIEGPRRSQPPRFDLSVSHRLLTRGRATAPALWWPPMLRLHRISASATSTLHLLNVGSVL